MGPGSVDLSRWRGRASRQGDSRSQSAVHRIRKTREHIHLCESVEGLLGREGQLEIGI